MRKKVEGVIPDSLNVVRPLLTLRVESEVVCNDLLSRGKHGLLHGHNIRGSLIVAAVSIELFYADNHVIPLHNISVGHYKKRTAPFGKGRPDGWNA